jgi:hypothetical protein
MEDMVIEFEELEILEVGGAVLIPYRWKSDVLCTRQL